jgi:hypothetical protein
MSKSEDIDEPGLEKESEVAINNFIELIESRIEDTESLVKIGKRAGKKEKSPWTDPGSFVKELTEFTKLYDAPEAKQTRMWPIRKPRVILEFLEEQEKTPSRTPRGTRARVTKTPAKAPAIGEDVERLFFDADLSIRNDREIIIELEYLKDQIVGMYEAKKRLIYFMFSFFMGGGKLSATGLNVVLGGNPGTGVSFFFLFFFY